MTISFSDRLLSWFDQHGRHDLPWQQDANGYRVWLSEIMLQQTQVATVIDYYHRFTAQYADLHALADASIDDVLALWTGLGYYARARNLHKTAQIVVAEHNGIMPDEMDTLIKLPGIGRSTAGAICALAYQKKTTILDGNVKRVLTRYAAISGWPGQKKIENQLWSIAEKLLPEQRIADYIQAQMDLGATVCLRNKPLCLQCPLNNDCLAYQRQQTHLYPTRKTKKTLPKKQTYWLILQSNDGEIFMEKRPMHGIWGGLWSFPAYTSLSALKTECQQRYQLSVDIKKPLSTFTHSFTHFKLDIQAFLLKYERKTQYISDNQPIGWYNVTDAERLGLPSPVKALLTLLE